MTSQKHARELLPIHRRAIAGCDEVGEASRNRILSPTLAVVSYYFLVKLPPCNNQPIKQKFSNYRIRYTYPSILGTELVTVDK